MQADGDGGDSLNRLGCALSCSINDELLSKVLLGLYNNTVLGEEQTGEARGRYCRNPAPGRWYSNYNNTTRDQMLPVEAGWAINSMTRAARMHFALRLKRGMLHFSSENDGYDSGLPAYKKFPDVPTPVELGVIIRAGHFQLLRPLLYILDLFLILDVAVIRKLTERNLYDTDNQLLPCVIAGVKKFPTFLSRLAAKIYSKTDAPARLRAYHGPDNNGIVPLGEIMCKAFEKLKEVK